MPEFRLPVAQKLYLQTNANSLGLQIGMDVGEEAFTLAERDKKFLPAAKYLLKTKILTNDSVDSSVRCLVDLKTIGKRRSEELRQRDLAAANDFLRTFLWSHYNDTLGDETLVVGLGTHVGLPSTGRIFMSARVKWPQLQDKKVGTLAGHTMRLAAKDLKYARESANKYGYDRLVYADLRRDHGVTLQTNEMGSCSMDTDGSDYDPTEPIFTISGHNLYSVDQQLILLAGIIMIDTMDEVLQQHGESDKITG